MHRWRVLPLVFLGAGQCPEEACCFVDGELQTITTAACDDEGGTWLHDGACDYNEDPDVDDTDAPPVDETDDPLTDDTDAPTDDTDPPDDAPSCATFCAAILVVCPGDTSCEYSCETYATIPPTEEAVQCARDAADCPATGACWDLLGL